MTRKLLAVTAALMLAAVTFTSPQTVEAKAQRTIVAASLQTRGATLTGTIANGGQANLGEEFANCTVFLNVTAVSGTSPTLDLKLQDSPDGVVWADIGSGTGAGTGNFVQATTASTQVKDITTRKIARYVRIVGTLGGSATPTVTYSVFILVS